MTVTLYVGENAYFLEFYRVSEREEGDDPATADWAELGGAGYAGPAPGGASVGPAQHRLVTEVFTDQEAMLAQLREALQAAESLPAPPAGPVIYGINGQPGASPARHCKHSYKVHSLDEGFLVNRRAPVQRGDLAEGTHDKVPRVLREVVEGFLADAGRTLPGPVETFGFHAVEEVVSFLKICLSDPA